MDTVEQAIATESISNVKNETVLIDAALATIDQQAKQLQDAKIAIFNLNADGSAKSDGTSLISIDWNPTYDSALLKSTFGKNTPLLISNAVTDSSRTVKERTLGIIGDSPSRFIALAGNPIRNEYRFAGYINAQMQQLLTNSVQWLTQRNDLTKKPFKVVLSQLNNSLFFPDRKATRAWLDQYYKGVVQYNNAGSCDNEQLASCLAQSPDLLIISQYLNAGDNADKIHDQVEEAMKRGIPVLYMHYDGTMTALGQRLFALLDINYFTDNYWHRLGLSQFNGAQSLGVPANIASIQRLLQHLKAQDYAFDWRVCDKENCNEVPNFLSDFQEGANEVRSLLQNLDQQGIRLFEQNGRRLEKLLVLIGDRFRANVRFPMDKESTPDNTFLQSFYADYSVYYSRANNTTQPDMGNFSRSDFSHITPIDKTLSLTSKRDFRSTGLYLLPGKEITITRQDDSDVVVSVFINTQHSGSTHQFAKNGYKRPKFLSSVRIPLLKDKTIKLSSPYGGPIQLKYSTNELPVKVRFTNVGEHPFWQNNADNARFNAALAAGEYDWAEIATPSFEVHSQLSKMRDSVKRWGSAKILAANTMQYVHNYPHVLAGFRGIGIDKVPEIHQFAESRNLKIELIDLVKHMNADQSSCGYGCSGNPYDAYWSFNPVGHGDIHELGHGLEKSRFRFAGWQGHSTTNPYAYYTKSLYHKETGNDPDCQALPFKQLFTTLSASLSATDPQAYLQTQLWDKSDWSHQVGMMIQLMMTAQGEGKLVNGWHVLARLHILERAFKQATKNDTTWLAQRDVLGFSQYSLAEAKAANNNDWMLISLSQAAELDFRDYLTLWGLPFTEKAAAQVASYAYASAPRRFYMSDSQGYCKTNQNGDFLGKSSVLLTKEKVEAWPEEVDSDQDGYWDSLDNCPSQANSDQLDSDQDGIGDVCDNDNNSVSDTNQDSLPDDLNPKNEGILSQETVVDSTNNTDYATHSGISLKLRVLLQGAYQSSTELMRDALRRQQLLPSTQPYTTYPFLHEGSEKLSDSLLAQSDHNAPVDWVLVEIRRHDKTFSIVKQLAFIVQRDGNVVDSQTGSSVLMLNDIAAGDYYIAIRHRNHLGTMTQKAVQLSSTPTLIDFSLPTTLTYGENARFIMKNKAFLWSGDTNGDSKIVGSGPNNDSSLLLTAIFKAPANKGFNANYRLLGYHAEDLNLDGYVLFSGPNNDADILLGNILLYPTNTNYSANYIVQEQFPQ